MFGFPNNRISQKARPAESEPLMFNTHYLC